MALDKMTNLFAIFLNSQQKYTMFVGTHLKSLAKMLSLYIGRYTFMQKYAKISVFLDKRKHVI